MAIAKGIFLENWAEQFLLKELKPGQVVVIDNAVFHRSQRTKYLIESSGCAVILRLPYCLKLNPIEEILG
jgi:hypothetical protein